MESRSCLNMGDGQLSVLASGKGTLIFYLCELEQCGHNINEGLVIVPIIIAMSKCQNWMMKRGFVNICWSHLTATPTAKCRLLTSAWWTKAWWPHFFLLQSTAPHLMHTHYLYCLGTFFLFCFSGRYWSSWKQSHTGVLLCLIGLHSDWSWVETC